MNEEMNYKFILGYQRGSGILLANDSLDITKDVIRGINDSE
jgi:Skp family chaperone for outer membrane proteins